MNWKGHFLLLFTFSCFIGARSQHSFEPIDSYHKDQLWKLSTLPSTFLPKLESQFPLRYLIRDSSKQYYYITQKLFKEYLVDLHGDGYDIKLTPVLYISRGKDNSDTSVRTLFNNTRGVSIEVDLLDKISFSTAYFENQNRFANYETLYYNSIGERYPDEDSTYHVENAVVPGAARTKPFKEGAYDYGYAIGSVTYAPKPYLSFSMGNNSHFVGKGYRSLFLSDNSVPASYFRADWHTKKFTYTVLRNKYFNLLRRPFRTTVEAYYEDKLSSTQYISYSPFKGFQIGYFEGTMWSIGDSVSSYPVNAAYYSPIPFLSQAISSADFNHSSINGVEISFTGSNFTIYSQTTIGNLNTDVAAFQLGGRWYAPFGVKNLMLQTEYNNVPNGVYSAQNPRLNYGQYNLPLAHPKGEGFEEVVIRFNYSFKRIYLDFKGIHYSLHNYQNTSLVVAPLDLSRIHSSIYQQQIELGYRINPLINLKLFMRHVYRTSNEIGVPGSSIIMVGLITDLIQHYNDF